MWQRAREQWEQVLASTGNVQEAFASMGRDHVAIHDCKFQLAELWVQALSEANEDAELRRELRRHMRKVHDFVAGLIRRGQEEGVLNPERNADVEAWTFLAGGVLGMVGRRIGLLADDEVAEIRAARLAWLTA